MLIKVYDLLVGPMPIYNLPIGTLYQSVYSINLLAFYFFLIFVH